jgi:O-antigen ligase
MSSDLGFLNKIDNYWLRLLLEGGMLGVLLFLSMFVLMMKKSIYGLRCCAGKNERYYFAAMFSFFSVFITYKLFLSMPTNNVYFFMVCAMFFSHLNLMKSNPSYVNGNVYAHPSHA